MRDRPDVPSTIKRHSLLEHPDEGDSWPEGFDAITVYNQAPRLLKVGELRRNLDNFFDIPFKRDPHFLYGALRHHQNPEQDPEDEEEYSGVVFFDTNNALRHVAFIDVPVAGTVKHGYAATRLPEIFSGENNYHIEDYMLLTYFSVPINFVPGEKEILSCMIAAARDELRIAEDITRGRLAAKTLSLIE